MRAELLLIEESEFGKERMIPLSGRLPFYKFVTSRLNYSLGLNGEAIEAKVSELVHTSV
jgi:hypothetical protein